MKEAENAATLTFHIDELRNRLTSFFVGLSGVFLAAVSVLIENATPRTSLEVPSAMAALLLVLLSLIGVLVIRILARLRHVQLEHFAVLENIRAHCLEGSPERDVIGLSAATLPDRRDRQSGTYFWTLLIVVMSSVSAGAAAFLITTEVWSVVSHECGFMVSAGILVSAAVLLDWWWMTSLGGDSAAEKLARAS